MKMIPINKSNEITLILVTWKRQYFSLYLSWQPDVIKKYVQPILILLIRYGRHSFNLVLSGQMAYIVLTRSPRRKDV